MGDNSKRGKRWQLAIKSPDRSQAPDQPTPRCHCGAPAKYEVNRKSGMTFVCVQHVRKGL